MTFSNPSLLLTFLENSTTVTVSSADIVKNSIARTKQLLNDLEPSSNTVQVQLAKTCTVIESIISAESDIRAVLKDGNTVIFTGYISSAHSWGISEIGESALNITLEDVGTRLLPKDFISSGYHTFNSTLESAVRAVCTVAGVTVSSSAVFPVGNVVKGIEGQCSCQELLTAMLSEFSCVYYFDANGELKIYEVKCESTSGIPEFDNTNLQVVGGKAVSLSKKVRQYKNARVTYSETAQASNYTIYSNTTKDREGGGSCYLELSAGQKFDGIEKYTPQAGVTRSPAYVEAVNATSEGALIGSNEILVVSSATIVSQCSPGLTASVSVAGGKYLSLDCGNSGNVSGYFSQLDVKGSVIYRKAYATILTTDEVVGINESNNVLSEELTWIHTKALAVKRANILAQYHRYSGSVYTFYSATNVALGTVVRLHENEFSGLDVNVLLIASTETDQSDVIRYTAVGITVFNTAASTSASSSVNGANVSKATDIWDFEVENETYVRDMRSSLTQSIGVKVRKQGAYASAMASWSTVPSGLLAPSIGDSATLTISYKNSYDTIEITLSDGNSHTVSKSISVVERTDYNLYLGIKTSDPANAGTNKSLAIGDYYIFNGTTTSSRIKGTPYEVTAISGSSVTWTAISITSSENAQKLMTCLENMVATGTTIPENTAFYTWCANLVAQNAVIKNLYAKNVEMGGGSTSSGFLARIEDNNNSPIFDVWYGGKCIFKIAPTSGNIFFGEPASGNTEPANGFMYRASDSSIISKNEKIKIDSTGKLTVNDADIKSQVTITGASIGSATFAGQIDCSSFSSLPGGTGITYTVNVSQYRQFEDINAVLSSVLAENIVVPATMSIESTVAFVKKTTTSSSVWQSQRYEFFTQSLISVGFIEAHNNVTTYSDWFGRNFTLTAIVGTTGDVFKFKNLPTSSSGLESGQVWCDTSNGKVLKLV